VHVVFRSFCCDLSENGFKDKFPKYLLGMGDLKPKYISDWDPFISIQFTSQQIGYASYHNIFCVCFLNEGLLFSAAGLSLQSTVLSCTRKPNYLGFSSFKMIITVYIKECG
jgi:hypothetical protein